MMVGAAADFARPTIPRWWKLRPWRFGLRTLLVGITVVCIGLAVVPYKARQYQQLKGRTRQLIRSLGGTIDTAFYSKSPSPGSNWLSRKLGYVEPNEDCWTVNLADTSVSISDLRKLANCDWIRVLNLSNTQIGDDSLEQVARLSKLRQLRIANTRITDSGLAHLKTLRGLLILDVADTAASYNALVELEEHIPYANLQEQFAISRIEIPGLFIHPGTPTPRRSMRSAAVLKEIRNELAEMGGFVANRADAAATIHFTRSAELTADQIEDLRRLVSATNFIASGLVLPPEGLKFITNLSNLSSITIDDAKNGNLRDEDLKWIAELPQLESLTLYSPHLSDDGLANLADAPRLRSLSLSGNEFTNAGVAHTARIRLLTSLSLAGAQLTPGLLEHLRSHPSLRELHLSLWLRQSAGLSEGPPSPVEIAEAQNYIKYLADIPTLKELSIRGNLITADVLEPATKLPLERLIVDRHFISHEAARKLQEAMPHCHVLRSDAH